jgi:hypothetical protein
LLINGFIAEHACVHQKGYFPSWHPFYRRAAQFSVHPNEEIGPQLREVDMPRLLNLNFEVRGLVLVVVLVLEKLDPAVTPSEQINCGKIDFRYAARPKIERTSTIY